MSELAQFFGLRLLLVLLVFGYVSNVANTDQAITTALDLGYVSSRRSLAAEPSPEESVRGELARLQKQNGLSLVLIDDTIGVLILSRHPRTKDIKLPNGGEGGEISRDGTEFAFSHSRGVGSHLTISRIDGTDLENTQTSNPRQAECAGHTINPGSRSAREVSGKRTTWNPRLKRGNISGPV